MVRIGFGAMVAVVAAPAGADHAPRKAVQCTYESNIPSVTGWQGNDPVGVTSDGYLSAGLCYLIFPETKPISSFPTYDALKIDGEYTVAQASIVDDVWGSNTVGGHLMTDPDADNMTGEEDEGEFNEPFCGTSPSFEARHDNDGDGHKDFGGTVEIWINGPVNQAIDCDPTAVSGGILNPAGGVYLALAG